MNTDTTKPDLESKRRYLFDLSFDDEVGGPGGREAKPTFSQEDMEKERQTAYQNGFAAGAQEAKAAQDANMEILLKNIDCQVAQVSSESTDFWGHQLSQLQRIALMITKKILPAYTEKNGLDEIEAVVTKVMTEMSQEPRLVFRVPESQFDDAKKQIDTIAAQAAYAGTLVILGDKELGISECRIEWADGGIERDLKKLWSDIDTVMAEVQSLDEDDTPHQTEPCVIEEPSADVAADEPLEEPAPLQAEQAEAAPIEQQPEEQDPIITQTEEPKPLVGDE